MMPFWISATLALATPTLSRRAALLGGAGAAATSLGLPGAALADAAPPTVAQQNLASLNAGSRRLSDAGVMSEEGDLVSELLRRTEANRDRNAALVKKTTEANAFTAIDGSVTCAHVGL